MGAALTLRGIERRFGEAGLRGVDLEVGPGELFGVVGPSGSGKSTLLRVVAGLDRPDRGQVLLDGRDVTSLPPVGRSLGMTFDDAALYEHLDVRGNIAVALDRQHRAGPDLDAAIRAAADLTRCGHLLGRRAEALSSGERRRVALARAVARRPALLLLDEPLGHLDRPSRLELRDDLRELQRALEATTLMVTHDHEDAIAVADRVAFLHGGRILQVGSAEELWRRPSHVEVARGFGPVPMNLVATGDGGHVAFRPDDVSLLGTEHPTASGWCCEAILEPAPPDLPGSLLTARLASGERVRLSLGGDPRRRPHGGQTRLFVDARHVTRFRPDGSLASGPGAEPISGPPSSR